MRKIILAAALAILASPALADGTIDTLGAAAAIGDTNTIPTCQGCSGAVAAVGATGTQLTTYFRSKLSGSSPIGYNNATGAISLPLVSAHLLVGSAGGVAADVAASGDLSLANTGAFTIGAIGGKTVSLGGSLTTSGASALTFTTTGATNVILPTTGTLMNNALTSTHIHVGAAGVATDVAVSGDLTMAATGAATIANNAVTNAKAAQASANTMKGNWSNTNPANVADNAMPSCPDTGTNHLNYVTGTGVTCGTAGGGGSGTSIVWSGITTGSSNAYALAASGFALTDGNMAVAQVNFTNTGTATINVNSTGLTAIKTQNNSGTPVALVGGELVSGNRYIMVYSSAATAFVILGPPPSGSTTPATSVTITQAQWGSFHQFVVPTPSQTFILPVATFLSSGGGIIIQTRGTTTTLTPNAADGINGGAIGASVVIPSNTTVIVSTSGASGSAAFVAPLGPRMANGTSWVSGQNLAGSTAVSLFRAPYLITIRGIKCRPDTVVGGTATIAVWTAPDTVALSSGSGGSTKLNSTDCNANIGAATEQDLGVASATIPANNWVGIAASGGSWATNTGAGSLQIDWQ